MNISHAALDRRQTMLLYAFGWLLVVCFVALNTYISHHIGGDQIRAWKALIRALAFCSFWIISIPLLWSVAQRFSFDRRNWIKLLVVHSVIAMIIAALIVPFRVALDLIPGVGILHGGAEALFRYYAATLPARSVILYGVFMAASQAALFYRDSVRQAELAAELRHQVAELVEGASRNGLRFAESFTLRESGRIFALPVNQIDWIEAAGNYVSLHMNSRTYLLRETMNAIEAKLDPELFVRVKRSAIVRIDRVQELRALGGGRLAVVLQQGAQIVLGRAGKQKLESLIPQLRFVPTTAPPFHG
jgi:hypothetical protein